VYVYVQGDGENESGCVYMDECATKVRQNKLISKHLQKKGYDKNKKSTKD